jgi:hypothetical protein
MPFVFNPFLGNFDWTADISGKQDADAGLTSLAGLTYASTSFVKMTGADTFTLDTNTYLTTEIDPVFQAWLDASPLAGYVPYSGATTDVNLGEYGIKTNKGFSNTSGDLILDLGDLVFNRYNGLGGYQPSLSWQDMQAWAADGLSYDLSLDWGNRQLAGDWSVTGSLGINTTTPSAQVDILATTEQLRLLYDASNYTSFTVNASGNLTITPSGGLLTIGSGLGIGIAASPNTVIYAAKEYTSTSGSFFGFNFNPKLTLTADSTTGVYAMGIYPEITGHSYNANTLYGIMVQPRVYHTGGTLDSVVGLRCYPVLYGTSAGIITNLYNLMLSNPNKVTGSTETIGTQYQLYIDTPTQGTTNWAIYSVGGNSYFGGAIGIGTTGADAKLDVLATTEQLRLTYTDGSVYSSFNVNSSGQLEISPTGGSVIVYGNPTFYRNSTQTITMIQATDTAGTYPYFSIRRSRNTYSSPTSVVANDYCGGVNYYAYNSSIGGSNWAGVAAMVARVTSVTANGCAGYLDWFVSDGTTTGANLSVARFTAEGLVVNELGSSAVDTRVEGDTNVYLFFVDASSDSIGVNTSTPAGKFDVVETSSSANKNLYAGTLTATIAANTTKTNVLSNLALKHNVETGFTDAGQATGLVFSVLRNFNAAGTDDSGTLTNLFGISFQYGHNNTNTSAAPVTTNAYGVYVNPYYRKGTISNMYDVYLASGSSGGTVTDRWSIYQASTASKNYFASKIILPDNVDLELGTGLDASLYYNGTNTILKNLVGSGIFDVQMTLQTDGYNAADGSAGVSGSFTTADSKTVTVKNGIITAIV